MQWCGYGWASIAQEKAIERAQAGSGGFGVVLLMAHDWADWNATQRSYELFAHYVIPHFQGRLDGRRTSYDFSKTRLTGFQGLR